MFAGANDDGVVLYCKQHELAHGDVMGTNTRTPPPPKKQKRGWLSLQVLSSQVHTQGPDRCRGQWHQHAAVRLRRNL